MNKLKEEDTIMKWVGLHLLGVCLFIALVVYSIFAFKHKDDHRKVITIEPPFVPTIVTCKGTDKAEIKYVEGDAIVWCRKL